MFMERIICAGASEIHLRHIRVKEALIHSQSHIESVLPQKPRLFALKPVIRPTRSGWPDQG